MKANSDEHPGLTLDLGDGTYYRNWNIEQKVYESGQTYYEYDQELLRYSDNTVPEEVAAWRLRAVTDLAGLTSAIAGFMDALPDPEQTLARHAWYAGTMIRRNSVTITAFKQALAMTDQQIDQMFLQAQAIDI